MEKKPYWYDPKMDALLKSLNGSLKIEGSGEEIIRNLRKELRSGGIKL